MAGAPQLLGAVHGGIGVAEQLLGPRVPAPRDRDADAGGGEHLHSAEIVGRRQLGLDALRVARRVLRSAVVLEEEGELVSAQPRHGVAGPDASEQPLAHRHEQPVAHRMAQALVDVLEAVHVEEEDGEAQVRLALQERHRLPQPVHEQRAVRQPGESVVKRVVEELLLGFLALGDVGLRSGHPRRLALRVAHRRAAQQDPPPGPVRMADAVLHLQVGSVAREVPRHLAGEPVAIVRVHPLEPRLRVAAHIFLAQAEHLLPAGREVDAVGGEVPVPEPVVGAALGQGVALLALPQRALGAPALGDVEQRAGDRRLPGELGARSVHLDLDRGAVLPPRAEGVVHALHLAREAPADVLADQRPVRLAGELLDGDAAAGEVLARVAEDLAELRVRVDHPAVLDDVDAGDRLLYERAEAVLARGRSFPRGRGGRCLLLRAHPSASFVGGEILRDRP